MNSQSVGRTGPLLALTVLIALLGYGGSPTVVASGAPYLVAAAFVDLYCMSSSFALRSRLRKGDPEQTLWSLVRTVRVLVLIAWQLAILGLLNIWVGEPVGSARVFGLSGLLLVMSIAVSDRLVVLADSPDQDGGSKPLSFFGRRRTRRVYLWGFVLYPASIPIMLGLSMFLKRAPYPCSLHPPQLCLLLTAAMSAATAGLVFQRYHGLESKRRLSAICTLAALCVVGSAGACRFFLGDGLYVYALSSLTVMCSALSTHLILRASKNA